MALLCQNYLWSSSIHSRLGYTAERYTSRTASACRPKVYGMYGRSCVLGYKHWYGSIGRRLYWWFGRYSGYDTQISRCFVRPHHPVLRSYNYYIFVCSVARLGKGTIWLRATVCHLVCCRPFGKLVAPKCTVLHHL